MEESWDCIAGGRAGMPRIAGWMIESWRRKPRADEAGQVKAEQARQAEGREWKRWQTKRRRKRSKSYQELNK